jgi:hypothetical protein
MAKAFGHFYKWPFTDALYLSICRNAPSRGSRTHADKTAEGRPARSSDWLRAGFDRGTGHRSAVDDLRAAGCATVLEEHASGADRGRPVLARLLHEIRPGETLVVVRLDRLASSVSAASSHASLRQRRQGNLEARWQPAAGSSPLCPVLVLFTALDMDNTATGANSRAVAITLVGRGNG